MKELLKKMNKCNMRKRKMNFELFGRLNSSNEKIEIKL